jgi:hypothetical protein
VSNDGGGRNEPTAWQHKIEVRRLSEVKALTTVKHSSMSKGPVAYDKFFT